MIKRHLILATVCLSILLAGLASAGPFDDASPGVAQQIRDIGVAIQGVQSSVTSIQNTVDNTLVAPDQATTRFTPPAVSGGSEPTCDVLNVSSSNKRVLMSMKDSGGRILRIDEKVVLPGRTEHIFSDLPIPSGNIFCTFQVLNGSRTDIRASLVLQPPIGSDLAPFVTVVPAE